MIGVLRRSLPAWAPLAFHLVLFAALGRIHPVVIPLVALTAFGIAVLLAASGVLFGVLLKRTMTATVANLLLCVLFWMVVPMVVSIGFGIFVGVMGEVATPLAVLYTLHPGVHGRPGACTAAPAPSNAHSSIAALQFLTLLPNDWHGKTDIFGVTGMVLVGMALHAGTGAVCPRGRRADAAAYPLTGQGRWGGMVTLVI